MAIVVIGGGFVGQMVNCRLWHRSVRVLDWGPPPKHSRTNRSYGATYLWEPLDGYECNSFRVVTHVDGAPATEESIRRYKAKIGKETEDANWGLQFREETTGYEIVQLAGPTSADEFKARVEYNSRITAINLAQKCLTIATGEIIQYDHLVSTIPLFALLELIFPSSVRDSFKQWCGELRMSPIYVRVTPRPPDARYDRDVLYVNYLSDPDILPYRICDRGDERHYEGMTNMGMLPSKKLMPGKIYDNPRTTVTLFRLREYGVQSFGRFATWRSDELAHETFKEICEWARSV